jgi:hypothetical protein
VKIHTLTSWTYKGRVSLSPSPKVRF